MTEDPADLVQSSAAPGQSVPVERILTGGLPLEVARFGAPLALGMGLQTTFNLVDAYIIARMDQAVAGPALGAIGICDQLSALGTIISYGVSVATASILSRKQGAGDSEGVRHVAWQSLLCVLGLGLLFGFVALFGAKAVLADVVGAKGRVADLGIRYLRVMVGGSVSIFLLLHLTTIQRALGSSKTPISILIGANALNLVLAVLLVYGPGPAPTVFAWAPPIAQALHLPRMQLMGAAWATIIARLVALVPTIWIIVRRFDLFTSRTPPHREVIASILRIGWPTSMQLVVRIAAMLAIQSLVARAFTTEADQSATTALGIVFRLETMALFIGLGWGSAAQTFMGINLGAGHRDRAQLSGYYATGYNAFMMALLAALYLGFAPDIVGFFDDEPGILVVAVHYLDWVAPSYIGLGIGIVLGSAIQGSGASRQTLLLDMFVILGIELPLSFVAVLVFDGGPTRLWQVIALAYALYAVVYTAAYKRGYFLAT